MPHSSFGRAIGGFKPIEHGVRDYLDELEGLARYLNEAPEQDHNAVFPTHVAAGPSGEATIRAWLHRVVSAETRHLMGRDQPGPVDFYFDRLAAGLVAGPLPDPDELETDLSLRIDLLEQLAALPANYCAALLLKEGKGLRVQAVARLMGTTPASVRSVLYRARQALRAIPGI